MGIESYFKFVVGFEDTGNGKHTGLPLKLALDKLRKELPDLVNSEILMVGDSIEFRLSIALPGMSQWSPVQHGLQEQLPNLSIIPCVHGLLQCH